MKLHPPSAWFGPKKLGWGISPHTWEGWVVTAAFVGVVVVIASVVTGS